MSAPPGAASGGGIPPGGQVPPGVNPNVIFEDLHLVPDLAKAHGVLMGLVFVVIFPIGSFVVRASRAKSTVWFHVACQVTGWVMMLAGLAMGIKMGKILDRVSCDNATNAMNYAD